MDNLPPILRKNVGPFPVYVWALVVVAGIVAGRYLARRGGGQADDGLVEVLDLGANIGRAQGPTAGATLLAPALPSGNEPKAAPTTNDEWGVLATNYLAQSGKATGYAASQVIAKYLQGSALTPAEQAFVDAAVSHLGSPPYGAPIALDIIPPAPAPGQANMERPPRVTVPAPLAPSPAAPSPQQLSDLVYGRGFRNDYEGTGQAWAPAAKAGGVVAPAGATLSSGRWDDNGVLVAGTFVTPDGRFVSLGY